MKVKERAICHDKPTCADKMRANVNIPEPTCMSQKHHKHRACLSTCVVPQEQNTGRPYEKRILYLRTLEIVYTWQNLSQGTILLLEAACSTERSARLGTRGMRTPHSEKHKTWRPSGAHSAFARPSTPASISACQVSSRILKMWTTPCLAHVARICSESADQPRWVIHPSESTDFLVFTGCFPETRIVEELDGALSNSQVLAI